MSLDAVYTAAKNSSTVIAFADRPWSLATDDDLILIWNALNATPDARASELRRRLESEMQTHRGLEAEQVFGIEPLAPPRDRTP